MIAERLSAMTEEALKGSEGTHETTDHGRRSAESERNG